jgi:penicillin-binding protein 1A
MADPADLSPDSETMRFSLHRDNGFAAHWRKRWVRFTAYLIGAILILSALFWVAIIRNLPDARSLLAYEPPLPTTVRAYDGAPIHSYARERRVQLAFDDYPKTLINAYLSAEDKTFFSHGGIDYLGVVRAAFEGLIRAERPRGTSTITQQVAKNLLIGNEASYGRKVKEAILAYRIESVLTKEQILELYLNQIALGRNAFGVQAAARAYFGKDVGELSLPESAYLAILPKGPANYRPERFYERAVERRNWVLGEMAKNDFITESERDAARMSSLGTIARAKPRDEREGEYFLEEVRRQLIARFGETEKAGPHSVYAGGLWVRSSFSPTLQDYTRDALRQGLLRFDRGRGWSGPVGKVNISAGWQNAFIASNISIDFEDWRTALVISKTSDAATIGFTDGTTAQVIAAAARAPMPGGGVAFTAMKPGDVIVVGGKGGGYYLRNVPEISGGMVVQNPHTGQVVSMQGGFDARLNAFNRATQAYRQPGSTFKPFVYASALDHGMTPASIIVDGPFCVYQGARYGQKCFRNFGGATGAGPQTMRWGLEQSRNLMTVRAASQTGMQNIVKLADQVGLNDPGKPYPAVLAVALGAGDTTVMRMVNAYAMLANQGRALQPTLMDFVQDRRGKVIYRADMRPCDGCNQAEWDGKAMPRPPSRTKQVIDPMTAYQVVHMLEGVIQRGTAQDLKALKRPIFGKTGTTSGPTNVWFVGGSADLVAGVYMGFDQPRAMGGYAQGGTLAAPIFGAFAQAAMKDAPVRPFRATAGVRMVRIERRTGKRVYGAFPASSDPLASVIWEAFKPESEPRRSLRSDEVKKAATGERKTVARRAVASEERDSRFLEEQGGIY